MRKNEDEETLLLVRIDIFIGIEQDKIDHLPHLRKQGHTPIELNFSFLSMLPKLTTIPTMTRIN